MLSSPGDFPHFNLEMAFEISALLMCMSNYPKNWAVGYITPIHKAGDISDPNNYRGVSVTSALGKLFNSILDNRQGFSTAL
jgi:energy-converting hydrogenase Eha subunit F